MGNIQRFMSKRVVEVLTFVVSPSYGYKNMRGKYGSDLKIQCTYILGTHLLVLLHDFKNYILFLQCFNKEKH